MACCGRMSLALQQSPAESCSVTWSARRAPAWAVAAVATLLGLASSVLPAGRDYLAWVPDGYRDAIQCSDVIFMKPGTLGQYKAFRADREAWGYRGAFPHKLLGKTSSLDRQHIKDAQALGMKYIGSTTANLWGTLEQRPGNAEVAGETFSGEPLPRRVSEMRKPRQKRALMGCINIPKRRKAFLARVSYWTVNLGTDGMQYDDWRQIMDAMDLAGCFCPYCTKGFRNYLRQRLSPEEIAAAGISDIETFDYRAYLKAQAKVVDDRDFLERKASLPLVAYFRDFQFESVRDFYAEVAAEVRRTGGAGATMSTNNGLRNGYGIGMARLNDYLACEIHYGSRYRRLDERMAFPFKVADGLGLHIAANPWMRDWGYLTVHPRPQMVRAWIAATYALGHNMMVPHFQSALLQRKKGGSFEAAWYQMKDEETVDVYRFIKANRRLFDGYRSLAQVAVVYGAENPSVHRIDVLSRAMFLRNYPFVVFTSGTQAIPLRLAAKQLAGLDAVLPTCPLDRLNSRDREILASLPDRIKIVHRVEDLPPPVVTTEPAEKIIVSLRGKPEQRDTYICHVLNWHYDFDTDKIRPVDAHVTISLHAFGGRRLKSAVAHSPSGPAQAARFTNGPASVRISLPAMGMWSVLELGVE